ncbi:MAG: CoA transferase [Limnohabitans sp.]|nr:CoA transferase [Limnohabitans sp.]
MSADQRAPMRAGTSHRPPLQGVRVLDLTRLLPGPLCTLHLADLGADVIKVEDLGAGDYVTASVRELINRNKRGLCVDLKQPEGRDVLLRLCETADVLVEGFRPGVMARLGLGPEAVRARNPRLVYCSISGYGHTGPLCQQAGHDINYSGYAGVADQLGTPQGQLALSNLPLADLMGGTLTPAMGILAALFDAQRTGQGRWVDVAIADGVLAHAVLPLGELNARGRVSPPGQAKLTGGMPCYGLYVTQDERYLAVGAFEPKFWQLFCQTIGRQDLAPHGMPDTPERSVAVRQSLQATLASQPLAHWVALLEGVDCCVTPVLNLAQARALPQFQARGMWVEVDTASGERVTQLASPVRMSDFEFEVRCPAPRAGQHTREVLSQAGWCAEDIDSLTQRQVVR